ncbi:hypothetical protein [Neptunomonas sp.]|uniref:hypothetical protein n=1 Tax=Neptunomonas sp. TaxID=1971898 RepID=UPI0025CBFC24|nr:hypothetical protein [Neptunomonas sp.]
MFEKLPRLAIPGSMAECANCVAGRSEYIGESKWGIKNGIANYNDTAINQYGEWSVGNIPLNAKRLTVDIWVQTTNNQPEIDRVTRQINKLAGVPIVFDANNDDTDHETYRVFGICTDFYQVVPYATETQCNMEILGLR